MNSSNVNPVWRDNESIICPTVSPSITVRRYTSPPTGPSSRTVSTASGSMPVSRSYVPACSRLEARASRTARSNSAPEATTPASSSCRAICEADSPGAISSVTGIPASTTVSSLAITSLTESASHWTPPYARTNRATMNPAMPSVRTSRLGPLGTPPSSPPSSYCSSSRLIASHPSTPEGILLRPRGPVPLSASSGGHPPRS